MVEISTFESSKPISNSLNCWSMVTVCLYKQTMTSGCWFLWMKAEKHSFPRITLFQLEFWHNRSLKIIYCSHLDGITNTVKTSSRMVLWCAFGCNMFRCQNILSLILKNTIKILKFHYSNKICDIRKGKPWDEKLFSSILFTFLS